MGQNEENKESVLNGPDHIFEHGQYIKVIPKVRRLGGENGQFRPNRASNV
jgi:hypothetical protein